MKYGSQNMNNEKVEAIHILKGKEIIARITLKIRYFCQFLLERADLTFM